MTHKGTVSLETERLILRKFVSEDAPAVFCNYANDPEVTKFLTWKEHFDVSDSRSVIERSIMPLYKDLSYYNWAIVLKDIDEPIGSIEVKYCREDVGRVTLGYHIGKQWWGKGYTVEALRELLKFFFEEVDAGRIEAYHDPRNPNSGKVLQKAEFQFEGIMRKLSLTNQGICDLACYAIIADDYFAEKPRRCL